MDERIILVDENDVSIGEGEKAEVHRSGTLHRAFSVFIFDDRQCLLLQRRAASKYHSGECWANTCCGHPRPGESTVDAARRRLGEEMGLDCELHEVATLTYRCQVSNELIEHEFDHIYAGRCRGLPDPDPAEVGQWHWVSLADLRIWLEARKAFVAPWLERILERFGMDALKQWQSRVSSHVPLRHAEQESVGLVTDPDSYQRQALPLVSRTFALTIPQLPPSLRRAVTNAYLLTRMADTIEDDPEIDVESKRRFEEGLLAAVRGQEEAGCFADHVVRCLSARTVPAERALMRHLPSVLVVTNDLSPAQRQAIVSCLATMTHGMWKYQACASLHGLPSIGELERYGYCVAGVVGQMLAELFTDADPAIGPDRDLFLRQCVSTGLGLQLTNILKDQWEDREQGVCRLPRDLLLSHGISPESLTPGHPVSGYAEAIDHLVGLAHAHLRNGLDMAWQLPRYQRGIRLFVLWAIGFALLTLRNISRRPWFACAEDVKVSHAEVWAVMSLSSSLASSNRALKVLFRRAARDVPLTPLPAAWSAGRDEWLGILRP